MITVITLDMLNQLTARLPDPDQQGADLSYQMKWLQPRSLDDLKTGNNRYGCTEVDLKASLTVCYASVETGLEWAKIYAFYPPINYVVLKLGKARKGNIFEEEGADLAHWL